MRLFETRLHSPQKLAAMPVSRASAYANAGGALSTWALAGVVLYQTAVGAR